MRALGHTAHAAGTGQRQLGRLAHGSWSVAPAPRPRWPSCQAASTLSNGEPEAARGFHARANIATAAADAGRNDAAARPEEPAAAASTSASNGAPRASQQQQPSPLSSPALARRLASATSVLDVADALAEELGGVAIREDWARDVLLSYLSRGKVKLALSLYREMCFARRRGGVGRSLDGAFAWPPVTLATTTALVLGLCQQLCTVEALQVLADIKSQGMPSGSEEVGFGKVITSPLAPDRPLTVVQPQEGAKTVADGYSRYEYDVFTGSTLNVSSTQLVPSGNLLLQLGRLTGIIKKPPVAAIHEFVLQAPDSTSRTFRVGTDTTAVPAQVGERLTVVSAPAKNVRQGGLFNASPPGTKPGEALTATNHKTGAVLALLRPPVSVEQAALPAWVLPLAVVLAGGDAASSLIDPALPLIIAAGAASFAGGTAVGTNVLLPRLKQLPEPKVRVEFVRQQLLNQYNALTAKAATVLVESAEDVRVLARLWQLQNKMEAVSGAPAPVGVSFASASLADSIAAANSGGGFGSPSSSSSSSSSGGGGGLMAYEARIGRVSRARANIEQRLCRKVELLDGYARVMNMIEIEVEMDIEVPAAEVAGIQQQVDRLIELEAVQEDWRAQAEARDEVERLLRAV